MGKVIRIGEGSYKGIADKSIDAFVARGARILWQAVKSCFGAGYWRNDKPWSNDEGWKN